MRFHKAVPMTRKQILVLIVLVALNVLVLCVGAVIVLDALTPASTVVSVPTAIPVVQLVPATSAPSIAPPTPTLVIPPATPTSPHTGAILAALSKAGSATSYRMEFTMTVRGGLGGAGTPTKDQELTMLNVSGELSGKDSQVTMRGLAAAALSGDPNRPVEMISAAGKNFIHGPVPLLGAKENRWYVLPAGQATSYSSASPNEFLSIFAGKESELGKLSPFGSETLDGLKCQVYSADKNAAISAFMSLSPNTFLSQGDLSLLQASPVDAEYRVWTCSDGYFHQLVMGMSGKDSQRASQSVSIRMVLRFRDFGKSIKITPPASAIPAANPFEPTVTPTKKK